MATLVLSGGNSASEQPDLDLAGGLRYVARQPILDLRGRVHGYELLFRTGPASFFRGDGDLATRTMIDNAVIFGLDQLTGGLPAFVNCTGAALTEGYVNILPPSMTVLELEEGLEATPELIEACRKLKVAGFRLALDDFSWTENVEPLVRLADYIKVDFTELGKVGRRFLRDQLSDAPVALIALKVETQEDYRQACEEGFTLFQGYYFCRPVLQEHRKIPANRIFQIEILELLQDEALDMNKLGQLVKRDPSLTYRILRLVNSSGAMRQEVRSIDEAMKAVGEEAFRRIATIAITSELSDEQPTEVLRMSYVRGRFCELAATCCALDPTEQYLLGMLSMLPAMMCVPMEELAPALPLRDEIRKALAGADNPERRLLLWLEYYEQGNWAECDAIFKQNGLNAVEIIRCYGDAVVWAETALKSAA
jgi:EAL and modified HD-GYP domain-containing signal transduction protein